MTDQPKLRVRIEDLPLPHLPRWPRRNRGQPQNTSIGRIVNEMERLTGGTRQRPVPASFGVKVRPSQGRCEAGLVPSLALARVPQRRSPLDVEAFCRLGVEVGVGAKAAGMNAVDGAEVVDLVYVAGDAQRAEDLTGRVADELTSGFQEQRTVGQLSE